MKAQSYKDQAKKIKYPVYVQPKLNGLRLLQGNDSSAVSKSGLDLPLPKHWNKGLAILKSYGMTAEGLDGEVYAGLKSEGGISLQEIVSAFRKENENTPKLKYYIYDIPGGGTFEQRAEKLAGIHDRLVKLEAEGIKLPIQVVWTGMVSTPEEADAVYDYLVGLGYEGMMYRNADGLYEHGKRSSDLLKRKPIATTEAKVLSVRVDKNQDGVLTCELETGIQFDCLMRKDSHPTINYRKHVNAVELIGKYIELEMECLSEKDGVPLKPVGIGIREVNPETFEPLM
jgi:DNA ligase-1